MAAEVFRIEIPITVNDNTDPGVSSATKKMNGFDKQNEKTQKRLNEMNRTRYQVALEALDKATSVIEKVGSTVKGIAGKAWKITMSVIDKATAPIRGIFNLLKNPILQAGAVLGISVGLKDTIDTYSNFEATMSKVSAISGATADQMERLNEKAKEMGATTKFTAAEAGEAFTYMSMAGWDAEQMLDGISGIMSLSAADGLDLATTSDIVTDAITAFGLQAKDSGHFADVLAKASSSANTNVSMLGESFKYVAPLAGAMNYSVEDVSLALGLMANASVKGSMAGTSLKTALSNMAAPTDSMASVMEKYGISLTKSNGEMKSLKELLGNIRQSMGKLSETEKTAAASTLFGKEAMSGMLAIINASDEDYNKLAESIANADGAAQQMSETMLDNLQGSFTLLQSAVDGVKIRLGERLAPYLKQFANWLTTQMPKVEDAVDEVMDFVDEKVEWLKETINEFTSGEEWENADIWQKIKIAWDKIVAEPFSEWWNSTGKAWFAEKASSIGEGIGSGITTGLLALLGIDVSDALQDGTTVGGAFIDGFKQGFDTEKITEALKEWADNNKEIVIGIGAVVGFNLITGIAGKIGNLTSLFGNKGSGNTDGGSTAAMTVTSTTTTVNGTVVNVYGGSVNNMSKGVNTGGGSGIGTAIKNLLPSIGGAAIGGKLLTSGAGQLLLGGGSSTVPMLTGEVAGGAAAATGLTSAGSWLSKILTLGSTSSVIGADGTLLAVQGGVGGTLGSFAGALGSGATTAAGSAAVGAGAAGGIVGGILGLGSAVIDLFQGIGKSKEGDSKAAKDEYVTAGTKAGMVGAGAGIGAGIGALFGGVGAGPGALIGAGIGGIVSLFTGDKAGKAISDGSDEGGWLNNAWQSTKGFFTDTLGNFFTKTIPDGWNKMWGGISNFFTSSIPQWWGNLTEKVSTFFTETIPEKWDEMWEAIGNFFTEDVPYAIGYACGKVEIFFTETVPGFFGDLWDGISTFFTDTLPTWASGIWNDHIVPFFTESIPEFFGGIWEAISTFFTDTLPTWASGIWNDHIVPFFTESIPNFFSGLWESIVTFFTDTLPTWVSNVWNNNIVPFFTESIPNFFSELWNGIVTFFTETIPTWVSNVWNNNIVPFFTQTIPGFFTSLWEGVTSFVTETIPNWISSIGSTISGWFSSIGDWFGEIWSGIKSSFGAGYSDATGKHAWGGIMNSPHVGLVAEDGPEAIIPLSPSKSQRGLDLWMKAGQHLGVQPYADGDIVGEPAPVTTAITAATGGGGENHFEIKIEVAPEFIIQAKEAGFSEESLVAVIKAHIRDMADDIGDELAERLARIFANMPVKGVA